MKFKAQEIKMNENLRNSIIRFFSKRIFNYLVSALLVLIEAKLNGLKVEDCCYLTNIFLGNLQILGSYGFLIS